MCFLRREIVARRNVVEVDDLDRETLRHGVFHDIRTASRHGNEYLIHRGFPRCSDLSLQKDITPKWRVLPLPISQNCLRKSPTLNLWCPNPLLAWGLETMKAWGLLFGTRGHLRTADAGRRMVNVVATMKQRHSQKPDELYDMIEHCSPAPFLELFARSTRRGWTQWATRFRRGKRT